ncbi:hypothetical protein FA95DRAFT_1612138 [Auriscalpium vulgare]|uniref:Uncharacterized protein n=1 Tax=Auriscalpium vulgare TaxID=40419 RepID=A0ACB8R7S7_9AGAM|nr:hypothetical protein FA95DRAFT_1612138 [Auriscalpium vulgare]
MNAYNFWHGLARITNGTGLNTAKNHYKDFIRSMRCFRNIRMAKRGARAHDPAGITATSIGELVVECPACPQPGRNLPEGWEDAPKEEQWKYALFLAIDANFKLKLKNRGLADVDLAPGWAYFVEDGPYQELCKKFIDQAEMKHCQSSFAAVDHANIPTSKRFAVNGVGAVICARHCFYRKSGLGDIQQGERYCNIDYVLLSTIARTAPQIKVLVLSYDIACQFSKNLGRRMPQYPEVIRLNLDEVRIIYAVPKFHLLAHGDDCQNNFDLNKTEGVGRMCGEGLDDFFGAINWRKTINLGTLLARAVKEAVPALERHKKILEDNNNTIPEAVRACWTTMIQAWDANHTCANPYEEPVAVTTLADVRLELGEEEAAEADRGLISLHEMSASVFLSAGLKLEDIQRGLHVAAKDSDSKTPAGRLALQEKRNSLQYRIRLWQTVQTIYMPAVAAFLAEQAAARASPGEAASSGNGLPAAQPLRKT